MVFLLSTVMRMAKEASVTDHVWSIEEIIALII